MVDSNSKFASIFKMIALNRRSCKRFRANETIKPEILRDVLESSIRAPSSFNLQPTQIVMVQNLSIKQQLADRAMLGGGNQFRTKDCSALAVFLSDLEASKRIQRIYELEKYWGKRHPSYQATFPLSCAFMLGEGHAATLLKQISSMTISDLNLQAMPQIEPIQAWAYKNTSLVANSYILAATSYGLATTVMEGFDSLRMRKVLRIPDRYDIPMVVATGYDYDESEEVELTPRLNIEELVFSDVFGNPLKPNESTEGSEDEEVG